MFHPWQYIVLDPIKWTTVEQQTKIQELKKRLITEIPLMRVYDPEVHGNLDMLRIYSHIFYRGITREDSLELIHKLRRFTAGHEDFLWFDIEYECPHNEYEWLTVKCGPNRHALDAP